MERYFTFTNIDGNNKECFIKTHEDDIQKIKEEIMNIWLELVETNKETNKVRVYPQPFISLKKTIYIKETNELHGTTKRNGLKFKILYHGTFVHSDGKKVFWEIKEVNR